MSYDVETIFPITITVGTNQNVTNTPGNGVSTGLPLKKPHMSDFNLSNVRRSVCYVLQVIFHRAAHLLARGTSWDPKNLTISARMQIHFVVQIHNVRQRYRVQRYCTGYRMGEKRFLRRNFHQSNQPLITLGRGFWSTMSFSAPTGQQQWMNCLLYTSDAADD